MVKGEGTVHFASRFVPQLLGLGTRYGLLLGSAIKGTESTCKYDVRSKPVTAWSVATSCSASGGQGMARSTSRTASLYRLVG